MKIDGGLRELFHLRVPGLHWQAIETGVTGGGVPDSNYAGIAPYRGGVEGWVEFKLTETHTVKFRPEQPGWIDKRSRYGGRVWIAVRRKHDGGPRKGEPVDELWMIPGRRVLELQNVGLKDHYGPIWRGGPKNWDWNGVVQCLVG